jgi:hypothetical protein
MSTKKTDQLQTGNNGIPFFTRPATVKTMLTLTFYAVVWGLTYILDKVTPGDMCNPGGGFFILMSLPLLIFFLMGFHLVKTIRGNKSHLVPAIIHSVVLAAYLAIFLLLLSR